MSYLPIDITIAKSRRKRRVVLFILIGISLLVGCLCSPYCIYLYLLEYYLP